jgi:hypothetical protein
LARFIALLVKIRRFLRDLAGPEQAGEGWAAGFDFGLGFQAGKDSANLLKLGMTVKRFESRGAGESGTDSAVR